MNGNRCVNCYIDCTETVCSGNNTGIQRVVRNIISRHALISSESTVTAIPVVALNGKFYRYKVDDDRRTCSRVLGKVLGSLRNLLDRVWYGRKVNVDSLPYHPSHAPECSGDDTWEETEVSGFGENNRIHLRIILFCRKIIPWFFRCAFYLDNALEEFAEADIAPDDIIFYPDAFWHRCTFQTFTRYTAIKIVLLHDIIPITMPQVCDAVYTILFRNNLMPVLENVKGIFSVSQSELANIRGYLTANGSARDLLYDSFYPGGDFSTATSDPDQVDPRLVAAFSGGRTFVMVGTIEPRKNHAFVLDAFERFWQEGGCASLCIIGGASQLCADVMVRIDNHHFSGSRLFCFQNVNDAGVAYSYENCAGVIFASRAEGFGLPLVEAMWSGRPVLASDIAVFREIGGNYPHFFSPVNVQSLVDCIQTFMASQAEKCQPGQWLSWDESVLALFGKIVRMSNSIQENKVRNEDTF